MPDEELGFDQGIFSIAITWIQSLTSSGMTDEEARLKVAEYLEELSAALKDYNKQEKVIL